MPIACPIQHGRQLELTVTNHAGQPLAGATILAAYDQDINVPAAPSVTSDATGAATLDGLRVGVYTLLGIADDHSPLFVNGVAIEEHGGTQRHALTFSVGGALEVVVNDAEGNPVSDLPIALFDGMNRNVIRLYALLGQRVTTNDSGVVELRQVQAGLYTVDTADGAGNAASALVRDKESTTVYLTVGSRPEAESAEFKLP